MELSNLEKLQMYGDRVLVEIDPMKEQVAGLWIPPQYRKKHNPIFYGVVVKVGPGKFTKRGVRMRMDVKVGDKVLFTRHTGDMLEYEGRRFRCISVQEPCQLLGVLAEPPPQEA